MHVFVLAHHGSRRLVHFNVTAHLTAAWTLQQLREAIGFEQRYRYLLHDRASIFARNLDRSIERFGPGVLRLPPRSPMANAVCERLIGTTRRECLDWMTPISEAHLRLLLAECSRHCNRSRPHMSPGPGVPDPPSRSSALQSNESRHRLCEGLIVLVKSALGGLHHEYSLVPVVP
jgi:transposase InsO family protein